MMSNKETGLKERVEREIVILRRQLLDLWARCPLPAAGSPDPEGSIREACVGALQTLLWVWDPECDGGLPPEYWGTTDPNEADARASARERGLVSRGLLPVSVLAGKEEATKTRPRR